uniref:DNA mismatch repair protein Msh2 n=1 Tax=Sarcoptes scabiei TaxID=52283 RepID=A0A834RHK4_SARSC
MNETNKTDVNFDAEFINFYTDLSSIENTFRLFNHGTCYTLHDENAEYVSKNFLNTIESLKITKIDGIYSKTNPKSATNKRWRLEHEASPGCLGAFESMLYEDDVNVSVQLLSVFVSENGVVHLCSIDPIACVIYLGIFEDNDCLKHLQSLLVRSNPKECLIPENDKRLFNSINKNKIPIRKYQSDESNSHPLKPLLVKQKLFATKINDKEHCRNEYPLKSFFIQKLQPEKFVQIDLQTIEHLHLFSTKSNKNVKQSLFEMLNSCKTISGTRLLETFIRQPSHDLETIEDRLNIVEFLSNNAEFSKTLREQILPRFPDMSKLYRKLMTDRYNIKDIFSLFTLLEQLRQLKVTVEDQSLNYPESFERKIVNKLIKSIVDTNNLYVRLAKSLDLDSYSKTGEMLLNLKTFPDLIELNDLKIKMQNIVKSDFNSVKSELGSLISLEEDKNLGWFYRATKKSGINIHKKYCVINSSEKEWKFITNQLKLINPDYCILMKQTERMNQSCIKKLLLECQNELFRIVQIESVVSFLDVLLSFAKTVTDACVPYNKPILLEKGNDSIELIQFRHPILESIKDGGFVPNDIIFDHRNKFFIITGPNMGGKSTFLRSIGLCILMSQIGCFVPCERAKISLIDALYTRFSSNDDQSLGLSTFMNEMQEMAAIIKSAKSDSLVLIDELGRSTSTKDGYGIAQSISEEIAKNINCYCLFATHFHNLGKNLPNIRHIHMKSSFNNGDLVIHYKAIIDDDLEDSQSFGIEVMKSIKMPEYLIKDAQKRLSTICNASIDDKTFQQIISSSRNSCRGDTEQFIKSIEQMI